MILTSDVLAVSKLCELEADLSNIPKDLFEIHHNSKGNAYYRNRLPIGFDSHIRIVAL